MERRPDSSLFVNDGSFMEKFKQQHQEKEKEKENGGGSSKEPGRGTSLLGSSTPKAIIGKTSMVDKRKTPVAGSGGKLAFSLKQKSKPVAPAIKLGEDEEEEETDGGNMSGDGTAKRPKLSRSATPEQSSRQAVDAPPSPSDPAVKKVADKLASFVAKNGRQFENVTREKNPGTSPFKFLFDKNCADYKYYEYRLNEEEGFLSQSGESQSSRSAGASTSPSRAIGSSQRSHSQHSDYHAPAPKRTASSQRSNQHSNYQIPASALYGSVEDTRASVTSAGGR